MRKAGQWNHFNGQWRLDYWDNCAHYSVFDNIGFNQFEEQGYPNKK
jgi:hypothetical protein